MDTEEVVVVELLMETVDIGTAKLLESVVSTTPLVVAIPSLLQLICSGNKGSDDFGDSTGPLLLLPLILLLILLLLLLLLPQLLILLQIPTAAEETFVLASTFSSLPLDR